jgi:hypothetical protein
MMSPTPSSAPARAGAVLEAAWTPRESFLLLKRVFSFPVLLAVLLSLVMFWSAEPRFHDPDMWWHLKVGEIVWQTGSPPATDEFSYTTGNHPWIAHGWLAETLFYAAYKLGGHPMLMMTLCVLGSAIIVLLYALCALYSGNAKVALLGGLTGWFFATISLSIRPLLFGHLFLVLELLFLHLAETRRKEWLWALPPLFAVWVNCHGSFALGMVVLAVFAAASHIELQAGGLVSLKWEQPTRALLRTIFAVSCLALLVNPFGFKLAAYPLDLYFNQTANLANIDEWRPLNFQDARGMGVSVLAAAVVLLVVVRRKEVRLRELMLFALGSYLAVRHTRMVFVFGILAAPFLCRLLADCWRGYQREHDYPLANAVLTMSALVLMAAGFPNTQRIEQQIKENNPVGAAEFIRRHSLGGRMLNEYAWGGYLIWAVPENKVFIDGRTDIFDWTGVLEEYLRWYTLREDPRLLLDRYRIDFCVLNKAAPEARVLPLLPNWKQVYQDDLAVIFERTEGAPLQPGPATD